MESYVVAVQQHEGVFSMADGEYGREVSAHEKLAAMFAEVDAAFARSARLLSPYEMHMGGFHLRLLQTELLKTEADGRPSADIVMMAATWLLARVSGLTPELGRLLFSAAAVAVFKRAGDTAVTWLDTRAANFETEGQRVNLVQLYQGLVCFSESELRELCTDTRLAYDHLYGQSKSEKAWEMVACAVRYGCVLELMARCLERGPFDREN